jgi:RNA recognition motif-containing protein
MVAGIATVARSDLVGNTSLALNAYIGKEVYLAYVCSYTILRKGGTNMNIYVGNLSSDVTEEELREEFEAFGVVESINIIKDKYSGRSRGFGFVEMSSKSEAEAAIAGLKGKTLKDRTLDVNEARPRSDSRGGGFRGKGRQRRY